MFSTMRLNTKLVGSVAAVALVTCLLALVAVRGLDTAATQLGDLFAQSQKQYLAAKVNSEFQLADTKAKNFAMLKDRDDGQKMLEHLKAAHAAAQALQALASGDEEKKTFADIADAVAAADPRFQELLAYARPQDKAAALYHSYLEGMTEPFDKAIGSYVLVLDDSVGAELAKQIRATKIAVFTCLVLVALGLSVNLIIVLGVTRNLEGLISALNEGVNQVASGANQVAGSSQQLAEGASESASSLEETSSSMEEMASMTRQNSENAARANRLMEDNRGLVGKGSESVASTLRSMVDMNESAAKVSRIIKTIEEIAFQTNLLALNAAVEAARAGEHGRGFAVVAEEVRNLASRSAAAAKDTAALIEENARRAGSGMQVSEEAGRFLREIVEGSAAVATLVGEIAAASQEQSRGIGEINGAVSQMDKVTQRVTANAEELSSASEEMDSQAAILRDMVRRLVRLVQGSGAVASEPQRAHAPQKPSPMAHAEEAAAARHGNGHGALSRLNGRPLVFAGSADAVLPMNGQGLRAF